MKKSVFNRLSQKGFSLVEISVAIGIAAFSLTAIMSLFSLMLGTERSAMTQTSIPAIATSIVHSVKVAYANQTPITETTTFHFTSEGEVLDTPLGGGFTCEVTPLPVAGAPASSAAASVALIRMEVRRTHTPQILRTIYATVRHE